MSLKAVLFDFNGVIIKDELLHQALVEQLLIEENLRFDPEEYRQVGLGRSDRVCLTNLLSQRGRFVSETYLQDLITRKAKAYQEALAGMEKLPLYPGLADLIFKLRAAQIKLAVVSGALRSEVQLVLERSELDTHFSVIVGGDDLTTSKPDPEGYLLAVDRLAEQFPELDLKPSDCLAIEDTFAGLQAAKQAGIPVVGVANTYPFHMLHRRANWTVDYLPDLDLEWVQQVFSGMPVSTASPSA